MVFNEHPQAGLHQPQFTPADASDQLENGQQILSLGKNMIKYQRNDSSIAANSVGVLMLDTRFPRFVGDIGNPHTWPFNVILKIVKGTNASDVVGATSEQDLTPFIEAALELQSAGVSAITTSCGFLSLAQTDIASHLSIPFIASSLVQVPWVQSILPDNRQVGVLTIDSKALKKAHLLAAGINEPIPIKGCESGQVFTRSIIGDFEFMDRALCEQENVHAALALVREHQDVGALVLECTNMAPYAAAIHNATGLPVYSIYTLIRWLESGLMPRVFNEHTFAKET